MKPDLSRVARRRLFVARIGAAVLVASFFVACGPHLEAVRGSFGEAAFLHGSYPLVVSYSKPSARAVMGSAWRVANYRNDRAGRPHKPIGGPANQALLTLDWEDDGRPEVRENVPLTDLKLVHRRTSAVMWVRSLPVNPQLAEKEMRIILRHYVDMAARPETVTVRVERKPGSVLGKQLRIEKTQPFASRLLESTPASLGSNPAIAATFEVADVKQMQLNPLARWERTRVVLVKTGYHVQTAGRDWPILLIVGYSNRPEDFDQNVGALDELLARVHITQEEQRIALLAPEIRGCRSNAGPPTELGIDINDAGRVVVQRTGRAGDNGHHCRQELFWSLRFEPSRGRRELRARLQGEPSKTLRSLSLTRSYVERPERAAETPANPDAPTAGSPEP